MAVDAKLISKIRTATGAGIADVQSALLEADNNEEKAIEILRKKGASKAAKKLAERTTGEGIIDTYIHANGKIGTMVQLQCETDFVARNADFKMLAHDLALHIAAANPLYLSSAHVPADVLAKEKEIYAEQLKNEGKPAAMVEKILEGKVQKYYEEVCLLKQPFVKDDKKTIEKLIEEAIAKIGEKIEVTNFARFQI